MDKESIALIHFNNIVNDLSTTISKATDGGVTPKLFSQFIADFCNLIKDNPSVNEKFTTEFIQFVNKLNTDVDSVAEQSRALSKLVMFTSKYLSTKK